MHCYLGTYCNIHKSILCSCLQKKKTSRKTTRRCGTVIGGGEGGWVKISMELHLEVQILPWQLRIFWKSQVVGLIFVDQNGCFTTWIFINIINYSRSYDRFQVQKYQSCKHLHVYIVTVAEQFSIVNVRGLKVKRT